MGGRDFVRASRDGDQFHYQWAARQCLGLLPGRGDLVAVTVEGASALEDNPDSVEAAVDLDAGEQLIDVGLYYGAESRGQARLVRYIQLKHSTRRSLQPWTASGLEKTIRGFAERYKNLCDRYSSDDVEQRFRFEFTTNRPIAPNLEEALADLADGSAPRHPDLHQRLVKFTGLDGDGAQQFFAQFVAQGSEKDLWDQRNLLTRDISAYLPHADFDAPVQLKELVTRKATSEFESDPSIRRHDVLRALHVSPDQLQPAPSRIPDPAGTLARDQEQEIVQDVVAADSPVIIHADGGVGKSVLAARLVTAMPESFETVLYDCFGDGLYRNTLHFRHRYRDALVQMANELAARGLCHPLIPTTHADGKQYIRAFCGRLGQAVGILRARNPEAGICLIIDAADNAEMAAEEQGEPGSFVRDLLRTQLPEGVRLVLTCRTHRLERLRALPDAREIELRPFSLGESGRHLRNVYPEATDSEVAEFAHLSSSNPRVQALALKQELSLQEMLKQLGPAPTTVERTISDLLQAGITQLRERWGASESSQIDLICQGLAVLRPLVPVSLLAQLSGTSESAVRDFALDLGRPLLLKGVSLHFRDEPTETWFRETFQPDAEDLAAFLERLRPLAAESSYAAAALPRLLLQANRLGELVDLALSGEGIPDQNPLERRNVELQRLTFALKACLQRGRMADAAKLSLKAGGECAGEQRQNRLIQENTDLAGRLLAPDRIEEVVSHRTFGSSWMGSIHAYEAGLLSGRDEFIPEASSRLRMALDWLDTWSELSDEERRDEKVSESDITELALALLRLRGPDSAARFLRGWRPRSISFEAGGSLAKRLVDLGQLDQLEMLAEAAGNDVWLLLGIAAEARATGMSMPAVSLSRLIRLLGDRRVKLSESNSYDSRWSILNAVRSSVEIALRVLKEEPKALSNILRRYLPTNPPSDLASRFGFDRMPLLKAYALEAALRGETLSLIDVAPTEVREELEESDNRHTRSQQGDTFLREVGALLPWSILSAEIACGRAPPNLADSIQEVLEKSSSTQAQFYRQDSRLTQAGALEALLILRDVGAAGSGAQEIFTSWLARQDEPLWPDTSISMCHAAARADGFEPLAMEFAAQAYESLELTREDAELRANSYLRLARAVLPVSPSEARVYFSRAVEISSRIGDENLYRWGALLHLAKAAGDGHESLSRTAYRLSRSAELTYEYVARDKHFDWTGTVEAMTALCGPSALAILSRWRDRRFGRFERLLPLAIYRLLEQDRLSPATAVLLAGIQAGWDRLSDLKRIATEGADLAPRALVVQTGFRYMRVQPCSAETWRELKTISEPHGLDFQDIDRLIAFAEQSGAAEEQEESKSPLAARQRDHRAPNWDSVFQGVDLLDADALRSAYDSIRSYDPPYDWEAFFREAYERVEVGRRPELVRAIASWPDFGIFELRNLLEALPWPLPKQVALRQAVRDAVLSVCRREPPRVHRTGWGAVIPFEKLDAEDVVSDEEVVQATLEGFSRQVERLGYSEFFQLVDPVAACLSTDEADEALNFGFDLLSVGLQPDDGDGPWRPELEPPQSVVSALAGCIWAGLGSPVAAERWQSSHVVRAAVEFGWTGFLDDLNAWAESDTTTPFADQSLEFYIWHARQWLLVGLSRGAIENAAALKKWEPFLQRWLNEKHVLIRGLAARTLRSLVEAGELTAEEVGDLELERINHSDLPEEVYSGWSGPSEDEAGTTDDPASDEEPYFFGIDIGPYWLQPLGRAFGLNKEAIERQASAALRERIGWSGGHGWQQDPRRTRRIFNDRETYHSHGSLPRTDDLRAYHGYHAMMLAAGVLLEERPVRRWKGEPVNEFRDWLSRYELTRPDGRWLADRRDPRLVTDPPPPETFRDEEWRWRVGRDDLDNMLVTADGLMVFWGHWMGGKRDHRETVSIRSALVSSAGAEALAAALQTAPELARFVLPRADAGEDIHAGPLVLEGWVCQDHIPAGLDESDPWAEGLRYPGPAPSDEIVGSLGLTASEDGRTWMTGSNGLIRSETWTHVLGYGREEETVPGWRLSGNTTFVKRLLDDHPDVVLILSVEIRRRSPRHGNDWDDIRVGAAPYARYYLMGADGVPHPL